MTADKPDRGASDRERIGQPPLLVLECDGDGTILVTSPAPADDADAAGSGPSIFDCVPEEQRSRLRQALSRVRRSGGLESFDIRAERPEGAIWWSCQLSAVEPGRGPTRFVYTAVDVSAQRRAEEAARQSERRHRGLFEDVPIGLWEEDFSEVKKVIDELRSSGVEDLGRYFEEHPEVVAHCAGLVEVLDVNAAAVEMAAARSKQHLLENLDKLFTPESMALFAQEFASLAEGGGRFRGESVTRNLLDERILVRVQVSVSPGHEDTWSRVLVSTEDITDRLRAEQSLRESEARFRTICEQAPVMIDSFTPDGECLLWNRECEERLGWTREEIAACEDPLSLFYPEAADRNRVLESIQRADGRFREYTVKAKDGTSRTQVWADFRLPSGVLISVGHDITERKLEEQRRRRLEAQVLEAQKLESLGVLAGGIAHDFNNLLMSVLGNADLALRKMRRESPALDSVNSIKTAAQRAADLANQLLAYSGRGPFVVETIDLSRLVDEVTHLVAVSVPGRVVVDYDLARETLAIEGDPTQLRQVVMNLITNASEAVGDGEGRIVISTGSVECRAEDLAGALGAEEAAAGRYAFLEVSDSGCGMDLETQRRIFDPFFTTKFTGRGLGLASVLGIVRGHGALIRLDSQVGRGTTVRLLFPISSEVPRDREPGDRPPADWRGQGTVLLADDEPTVLLVARTMLEELGFEVLTATDGKEAVETFRRHSDRIVLVVLDLTMPRMSGEEALAEIRQIRESARVIVSSGYSEEDTIHRFAGRGLAGFIQKPYNLAILREKVRQVLGAAG